MSYFVSLLAAHILKARLTKLEIQAFRYAQGAKLLKFRSPGYRNKEIKSLNPFVGQEDDLLKR